MAKTIWQQEWIDYVKEAFDHDCTYEEIRGDLAERFSFVTTVAAVFNAVVRYHKTAFDARLAEKQRIRQEKIEEARKLALRGACTGEIASAVGYKFTHTHIDPDDRRDFRDDPQWIDIAAAMDFEKALRKVNPTETISPQKRGRGFTLLDLRDCQCHWPLEGISPAGKQLYCGRAKENNKKSYCDEHHKLGHV